MMAKSMAQLDSGTVVNMICCSDLARETDVLKDPGGRPVGIGDTYSDGRWYRDGAEILTPLDEALAKIEELEAKSAGRKAALTAIYEGVIA